MLKIGVYGPGDSEARTFLNLNLTKYHKVKDLNDADLIFSIGSTPADSIVHGNQLVLEVFHNYDDQVNKINQSTVPGCDYITNAVDTSVENPGIHSVDFLFNRTKAYYTDSDIVEDDSWYYMANCYKLRPIVDKPLASKIYLAPNKTYKEWRHVRRCKYRTKIFETLKAQFLSSGYIGNPEDSKFTLYSEIDLPTMANIEDLTSTHKKMPQSYYHYKPPHSLYYQNTFISIYGETAETGNSTIVTEKTYDPLLKGHFIMPFSTVNFINHLKSLGFLFPKFIDYSYDSIRDDDKRYDAYEKEVLRLCSIPLAQWRLIHGEHRSLLRHNQDLFTSKPYDTINLEKFLK
jgi:hypothetical protein